MHEKIMAYLNDWEKPASLENIDFETALYLRRMKERGHSFEFGKTYWKDQSVEVTLELPDQPHAPMLGSQEEWQEKREWYLKHASNSVRILREGISEGYITPDEDWMVGPIDDIYREEHYKENQELMLNKLFKEWKENGRKIRRREQARKRYIPKVRLAELARNACLKLYFIREAKKANPWEAYELFKQNYCMGACSSREYEKRVKEVVSALAI